MDMDRDRALDVAVETRKQGKLSYTYKRTVRAAGASVPVWVVTVVSP